VTACAGRRAPSRCGWRGWPRCVLRIAAGPEDMCVCFSGRCNGRGGKRRWPWHLQGAQPATLTRLSPSLLGNADQPDVELDVELDVETLHAIDVRHARASYCISHHCVFDESYDCVDNAPLRRCVVSRRASWRSQPQPQQADSKGKRSMQ
jgi:hypothetical protein